MYIPVYLFTKPGFSAIQFRYNIGYTLLLILTFSISNLVVSHYFAACIYDVIASSKDQENYYITGFHLFQFISPSHPLRGKLLHSLVALAPPPHLEANVC